MLDLQSVRYIKISALPLSFPCSLCFRSLWLRPRLLLLRLTPLRRLRARSGRSLALFFGDLEENLDLSHEYNLTAIFYRAVITLPTSYMQL